MEPAPPFASNIRLVSTDFDSTLVDHDKPQPFAPELIAVLRTLRRHGVFWVINTGRSPRLLDHGLTEYGWPIRPDFAITSEREICRPADEKNGLPGRDGTTWADYGDWNERCARDHEELFAAARPLMRDVLAFLTNETCATPLFDPTPSAEAGEQPAGLVAADEPEMDRIAAFLDSLRPRCPKLGYQRNKIYLRFCHADYDKGVALAELGRMLGLEADAIFAVGDHHNDLSMLDGRHARHVACPANAIDEVKAAVQRAGGHVASAPCSLGVIEALRRHFPELL
ncbi:MAG: HAD family phosphatase [Verrucomicrobia bacterium]|nr:HAD family phosphatase [Verrucomicrobiota bacterium]